MPDLLRDAPVGQILRWATGGQILKYSEEDESFICPSSYGEKAKRSFEKATQIAQSDPKVDPPPPLTDAISALDSDDLKQTLPAYDDEGALSRIMTRPRMHRITTRADLEEVYTRAAKQETLKNLPSMPIVPQKTSDRIILVDWYSTTDPENPQNWSSKKKAWVVLQIYLYTLAVYMGSAIYTPSEPYIVEKFGVSPTAASLGLALYVLGYGTGPLVFSLLSEIPVIGRNPPYMVTFGIFVILCVPTALVNNFAGLLVLRFCQGFFGSPCLATGGASVGDLYLAKLPYFLSGWAAFATCGPAMGRSYTFRQSSSNA